MKIHVLLLSVLVTIVGCNSKPRSSRVVLPFLALEPGMTMQEVTNKVGLPDRAGTHALHSWEYDLADGSQIKLYVKEKEQHYSGYMDLAAQDVIRIMHLRGTNVLLDKTDEREYKTR